MISGLNQISARISVSLFAILLLIAGAFAQVTATEQLQIDVQRLSRQLTDFDTRIQDNTDNDEALYSISQELSSAQKELLAAGISLTDRLETIRTRLEQLGAAPGENDPPEPDTVAAERANLLSERSQINSLIGSLEDASIAAKKLSDQIAERRRAIFTETLSKRYDIRDAFGENLFLELSARTDTLFKRLGSWVAFSWKFKQSQLFGAFGVSAVILAGIALFSRRIYGRHIYRDPKRATPDYFQRLMVGFWYTLLPTISFWLMIAALFAVFNWFSLMRADITSILQTIFGGLAIFYLIYRLARAILAPYRPNWRLLNVTNEAAKLLFLLVLLMAFVVVADASIARINATIGNSLPVTIAMSLISSICVGLVLIAAAMVKPYIDDHGHRKGWPAWAKMPLMLTGFVLILVALSGYVGFARFAAQQIVTTGAVLITMYLGYRAAQAIGDDQALGRTSFGGLLRDRFSFSDTQIDQAGLALSIMLILSVIVIGFPIIALLWGFQWNEVRDVVLSLVTEINIGSISISLVGIFVGIALFVVGLWATRRFQAWIDGKVLERSRVETGARNSIKTAIGYVGVAIAGLIGISAAGIDLSQLAFIAGALSLGIGFGLQNIVNNFVSGLILLAERPFKSGDIIEAGAHSGTVKKINVRATEITTFDRKTLILPNSELINSAVSNWMHRSTLGRVEILIGVSYDSEPEQVREVLLSVANDHPRVLSNPEPVVSFEDFNASSLDFKLFGFIADVTQGVHVRTELRMEIFKRFKALGIDIPFPQTDVNLRVIDKGATQQVMAPDANKPKPRRAIKTRKGPAMDEDN